MCAIDMCCSKSMVHSGTKSRQSGYSTELEGGIERNSNKRIDWRDKQKKHTKKDIFCRALETTLTSLDFILKVTGIPEGIRKNMTKGKKTVVITQPKQD